MQKEKWAKKLNDELFSIANWSPKVGEVKVVLGMQQAFKLWSKYSNLLFERVNDSNADIIIAFGSGHHGDRFPFDGPGNILAHAFYPYDMNSYGGDIHFDDDENWKENAKHLQEGIHTFHVYYVLPKRRRISKHHSNYFYVTGVDFQSVAAHELGHSLGLAHSPVYSSIMFPYYKGPDESKDLGYDDILAMYELYGKENQIQIQIQFLLFDFFVFQTVKNQYNDSSEITTVMPLDEIERSSSTYTIDGTTASPEIGSGYNGGFETIDKHKVCYIL